MGRIGSFGDASYLIYIRSWPLGEIAQTPIISSALWWDSALFFICIWSASRCSWPQLMFGGFEWMVGMDGPKFNPDKIKSDTAWESLVALVQCRLSKLEVNGNSWGSLWSWMNLWWPKMLVTNFTIFSSGFLQPTCLLLSCITIATCSAWSCPLRPF